MTPPNTPRSSALMLRTLGLAAGLAAGSAGVSIASAEGRAVAVPVAGRIEVFQIDAPSAAEAPATRLDARPSRVVNGRLRVLEGDRPAAIGMGWSLNDRVLVRAAAAGRAGLAAVRAAVGDPAMAIRPVPGLPGWFAVSAGRVDRAADLAARLLTARGLDAVEMDVSMPVAQRGLPNDAFFGLQWHLDNAVDPQADIGAAQAWGMGYTGQGVTICIVESFGFQFTHPDLSPNFNATISQPGAFFSSHMTAVAGLAAAVANNGIGVAGVAYNADLSQALIGSNQQIANALLLFNDVNDIKNNSWGPTDNGLITAMPAVVGDAIAESIANGRGGLGEILVWAGGNGNGADDRVDYDPYASSRYTIAVGAVGDDNVVAAYSEPGSSLLVSAYSDGGSLRITSTTTNSGYTFSFGGTSAASPIAAGVVALMLEANPGLTWRDVQHILVDTARPVSTADESWTPNGSDRLFSDYYGFGVVDAPAAVAAAASWIPVEPETSYRSGVVLVGESIPDDSPTGVTRTVVVDRSIRVESLELVVNVQSTQVGDLDITLTSPDGTRSTLSAPRFDHQDNLVGTVFTSVRHWGERSEGTWTVKIADRRVNNAASWTDFELRVHGVDLGDPPCGLADLAEPFTVLDLADVTAFLVAFLAGDPDADLAEPFGELNSVDIDRFIAEFEAGCP